MRQMGGMETEQIFDINAMNTCQWCGGLVVMSNIPLFWCQSKSAKAEEKKCIAHLWNMFVFAPIELCKFIHPPLLHASNVHAEN